MERGEGRMRTRRELVFAEHTANRGPKVQVMLQRVTLALLDRGFTNTPRRCVDDAQQADRILRRQRQLQVGKDVFDLGALVEAESTNYDVFAAVTSQCFLDLSRLKIRAVEHRHALIRVIAQQPLNGIGDE